MTQLDGLRRYIDAATTLTQITRGRAEELVRELVASGTVERSRAQDWIDDLIKRSREASEALMGQVSSEVDKQLGERLKDLDLDDLAKRVAGIIELAGTLGRNATSQARDRVVPGRGHEPSAGGAATESKPSKPPKQAKPGKPEKGSKAHKDSKDKKGSGSKKDPSSKKTVAESKKTPTARSTDKSTAESTNNSPGGGDQGGASS